LQRYIRLFVGKLGFSNPAIYYVDGFAGQGRYGDKEIGSAFIGAESAASPIQSSRKDVLRCINVEEDPVVFSELEKNLAPHKATGLITNLQGTFQSNLPGILAKVGNAPAFFFIDPFGSQGIETETLTLIRKGRDNSEILVRYDDTRVKRLLSWAVNNADHISEGHRKSALKFAMRVLQLTDEEALAELNTLERDKDGTREALIQGYMQQVRNIAGFKFALRYPIRNPRTDGHKYYLVHFCNHPDGYHYMAHFMALAERAYEEDRRKKTEDMFATTDQELMPGILDDADKCVEDARVADLYAALPEILAPLRGRHNLKMRWVYAAIVDRFEWRLTRKEWLKALAKAKAAGMINYKSTEDGGDATIP
jgi:three-Cys-motif partner protein